MAVYYERRDRPGVAHVVVTLRGVRPIDSTPGGGGGGATPGELTVSNGVLKYSGETPKMNGTTLVFTPTPTMVGTTLTIK